MDSASNETIDGEITPEWEALQSHCLIFYVLFQQLYSVLCKKYKIYDFFSSLK